MGKPRRIESPELMEHLWEEYKEDCNNQSVLTHDFSAKNSEFVSKELKRSVTCTIEGFCVYIGMLRQVFYDTYAKDPNYCSIVTRMKEECEIDARKKFELGVISERLAGLWMSKHGYSTQVQNNIHVGERGVDPLSESLAKLAQEIDGEG